jgi:hypothetical protein
MLTLLLLTSVSAVDFIHFSDLHLDLLSEPKKYGPSQFCREHLPSSESLRRSVEFMRQDGLVKAPFITDAKAARPLNLLAQTYNVSYGWMLCDAVPELVSALFADMAATMPNPDFIIGSGDWVAHLQPSEKTTFQTIQLSADIVKKHYPNTIVVPAVGNNDIFEGYNERVCVLRVLNCSLWQITTGLRAQHHKPSLCTCR